MTSSKALGLLVNDWQLSGVYRWTSGRPLHVNFSIPGIGAANLTGTDGNPNARIAADLRPGHRLQRRSVQAVRNPECFAPPQPGSNGNEITAVLRPQPAAQQSRPVGLEELPDRARR